MLNLLICQWIADYFNRYWEFCLNNLCIFVFLTIAMSKKILFICRSLNETFHFYFSALIFYFDVQRQLLNVNWHIRLIARHYLLSVIHMRFVWHFCVCVSQLMGLSSCVTSGGTHQFYTGFASSTKCDELKFRREFLIWISPKN